MKIKHKENILRATKKKQQITYKGIPKMLTAALLTEICWPEKIGKIYLK